MKKTIFLMGFLAMALTIVFSCRKEASNTNPSKDTLAVVADTNQARYILAKVYIKPNQIESFVEAAKGMISSSNAEPGCEYYQLFQDPYDKTKFIFVEKYLNQAAVEAHFNSDYFKAFGPAIGGMTSSPAEINIISAASESLK